MADSGTYDEATLARRYAMAQALLKQPDTPIRHWAQGLNQLAEGALGGYQMAELKNEAKQKEYDSEAPIRAWGGLPAGAAPEKVGGFQQLASLLRGGSVAAPQQPAMAPPMGALNPTPQPAIVGPNDASPLDNAPYPAGPRRGGDYGGAIASIESGGAYDKLGPMTKGDRAYGKYQVMGANVPEWTQAALGRQLTPAQFLADPAAQDAVFKHRFGSYADKYGPEGAARAWFAGEGGMNNPNAKDVLGTSVQSYADKFNKALGPQDGVSAISQALQGGASGAPTSAPVQVAQAGGGANPLFGNVPENMRPQIAQALLSKNPTIKALGQQAIANYTKADTPTDEIREYTLAQKQGYKGSFVDFKTDIKKAGKPETTVNVGGGSDKQIFDAVDESAKAARATATGLTGLREARNAIQGGAITGTGADARLALQKAGALLGVADTKPIVDTETFRAAIAPQVAATLKSTVGTANISNSDREFAEKAAGGNITLDKDSINRLLDIMERASTAQLKDHQRKIDAIYPDPEKNKRERALFGVEMPAAPPVYQAPAAPVATPAIAPDKAAIEAEMRRRGFLK